MERSSSLISSRKTLATTPAFQQTASWRHLQPPHNSQWNVIVYILNNLTFSLGPKSLTTGLLMPFGNNSSPFFINNRPCTCGSNAPPDVPAGWNGGSNHLPCPGRSTRVVCQLDQRWERFESRQCTYGVKKSSRLIDKYLPLAKPVFPFLNLSSTQVGWSTPRAQFSLQRPMTMQLECTHARHTTVTGRWGAPNPPKSFYRWGAQVDKLLYMWEKKPSTMSLSKTYLCVFQDPPTFRVRPRPEYLQEVGRELMIPCEASGDPTPNVTWSKVGMTPSLATSVIIQLLSTIQLYRFCCSTAVFFAVWKNCIQTFMWK